ncbi:MAG TPA: site-specific integrase [Gemmatimonadaceae bacterium]|nr:site-specific integrase [Gemmatimonadaceae bacterium]
MSAAFRRAGRRVLTVKVPTTAGKWVARTSGTRDAATAKKMQRMLDELGPLGTRAWDVLARLEAKTLSVADLWDLWVACDKDLDAVRARLDDVDLEPMVATWREVMLGPSGGVAADTAQHYVAAVRLLIVEGAPFKRSALTTKRLRDWIAGMSGVESATVRKRGQGMRRFTRYLVGRHVLATDPMRDVELPAPGRPRVNYLETADAKRLADAQPAPYRAFSALLAGSGIEVSVVLTLRRRDVDEDNREIRAAGTKTHSRDRIVRIADWAWEYVEPLLDELHPDALLFAAIPHRWAPQEAHNDAIAALLKKGHAIYAGYTMRDHRHTYAVRAIRAGTPAELVARQLGHVNAVLVHKVYGRFAPSQEERDKWEKIAAAQDAAAEAKAKEQANRKPKAIKGAGK